MEQPELNITIGKDGRLRVEVKGVHGSRCIELADLVRDIVGREDSRQLTTEYYEPDGKVRTQAQVRSRNGP